MKHYIELTDDEIVRKRAEKMFKDWVKQHALWHFFDDIVVNGFKCKYVTIRYAPCRMVLNLEDEFGAFEKSNLIPNARKDNYIAIFEQILTDPKTFIKSYFGV